MTTQDPGRSPRSTPEVATGGVSIHDRFGDLGVRETPERRIVLDVLRDAPGPISLAELVARCHAMDERWTTVEITRTATVLERLGVVAHDHLGDGVERYRLEREPSHGHLHCRVCGRSWRLEGDDARPLFHVLDELRGFSVDLFHVVVVGECSDCRSAAGAAVG